MSDLLKELNELNDEELVKKFLDANRKFLCHAAAEGHQFFKEQSAMYSNKDIMNTCETLINEREIKAIETIVSTYDWLTEKRLDRSEKVEWFDKNGNKICEGGV